MTKEELIQKLHESAEEIDERVTYNGCYEELYGYMFDDIADMVKDSDLVEVVRCKDCARCIKSNSICSELDEEVSGDFYCAMGVANDD